ncbi:MBL fold metallo-hydrolase [Mobilitalea sibirica]|uniref:MBL fold metallo-hydrolase n=1 Tax=Mobilitalea sibirica TaxID=1462919 RepID=A0A8J7KV70_9FIRM|nr:MBL fold metallo-hydrolase [Mobilitalea sibirica]MBH1939820.1 MBL fold metallo-hydrolase [Mobilitalea sibirica]
MIYQIVKGLSKITTHTQKILPDITIMKFTIVNAFIVGDAYGWVMVDTGLENSYDSIIKTTEDLFGKESRPRFIILTHGHFDHIGCVKKLSDHWNVKIYAHENEIPYVTGEKNYPEPDPKVDEGLVAKMSPTFPSEGINLGDKILILPPEGRIPDMPEWEWIHTPGHTNGHISLYRFRDKVLIVGDAFTTTKQESFLSVLTEQDKVKGPPAYLTRDWKAAFHSIKKLSNLNPKIVLPSHGAPMQGDEVKKHLIMLTEHFNEIAVPKVKQRK